MRAAGGSKQKDAGNAASQTSTVTVSVRARPFLPRDEGQKAVIRILKAKEEEENPTIVLDVLSPQLIGEPRLEQKFFAFDHCFDGKSTQTEVHDTVGKKIVENAVNGYNACVFAYGQTGSGKSFSIIGPENDEGLIPRVSRALPWESGGSSSSSSSASASSSKEAAGGAGGNATNANANNGTNVGPNLGGGGAASSGSSSDQDFRVTVSFLEIYNETLRDLLNPAPRKKPLYVHQHPKLGVYVPWLTEAPVTSHNEAMSRLDFGAKIRATAQTCMNSQSSRSHSLFIVRITRTVDKLIYSSSINLIDLAGSERVKKAGHHRGGRMLESSAINSSLSVLGLVISKLAGEAIKKGQHSVKKVRLTASVNQQDEGEADLMLQTFRTEIEELRTELHSNHNPSSPKAGRLRREVEAMESLNAMVSSKYDRKNWDDARRREKEQELMRQEVLANLRVGRIQGLASDDPYILNISDDVALTGRLLYLLDQPLMHVGSAPHNQIRLLGLGIGTVMCTIKREEGVTKQDMKLQLQKKERGGRLVINGKEITDGAVLDLKHGDRILVGRAFAFRLIMPGMPSNADNEAEAANAPAEQTESEEKVEEMKKLQDDVDESNELIRELLGESGPSLSVGLLSTPNEGASSATRVVQQRDETGTLVAVWLQSAFYCRLDIMRDLYQQHLENVRAADGTGSNADSMMTSKAGSEDREAWAEGAGGGKESDSEGAMGGERGGGPPGALQGGGSIVGSCVVGAGAADTLQATQVWEPGSTNLM
eukprot:g2492.t1